MTKTPLRNVSPSLSCSGCCCALFTLLMYKNNLNKQVGKLGLIINILLSGELKTQQWCTLYSPLFLWYTGTTGFHWQLSQRVGGKILLSSTVKNIVFTAWYHSYSLHYGKSNHGSSTLLKHLKCEGWSLLSRNYYFYFYLMLMNDCTGMMGHMEIVLKICKTSQKPIKHQLWHWNKEWS